MNKSLPMSRTLLSILIIRSNAVVRMVSNYHYYYYHFTLSRVFHTSISCSFTGQVSSDVQDSSQYSNRSQQCSRMVSNYHYYHFTLSSPFIGQVSSDVEDSSQYSNRFASSLASKETIIWILQVHSWLQASNNTVILSTYTRLWLTESEQAILPGIK